MSPTPLIRALKTRAPRLITGRRFASQEAPQYNEPSGWLFGEKVYLLWLDCSILRLNVSLSSFLKPPPPGQKRVKEPWEMVWYVGMFGGMGLFSVLYYYKPDRTYVFTNHSSVRLLIHHFSIQTWALTEAKKRMEARGEKYKYEPSSS